MPDRIIEIEGLSYSYPDGTRALSGVNLEVFKGDCLGIIGPNGAGKTTLLLHLNGLLKGNGKVNVCGLKVQEKNLHLIRSKVGLIFQDPDIQLFMPTLFEDVAFGPLNMGLSKGDILNSVNCALETVDMLKYKEKLAHHLSLGEKKRASIATVLSMNPEILVMDEPTGNLDPKHRRSLIEFINKLKLTKIIATHDLKLVFEICQRVVIIDRGAVCANGVTVDIFNDKDLLRAHGLEL